MIRILCINGNWPPAGAAYAMFRGFRLPQIGDKYDSEGVKKCTCGCGKFGYLIKSLDDSIIFEADHFVEIPPEETEQTKEPAVVFEGFFDWSFPYYEGGI